MTRTRLPDRRRNAIRDIAFGGQAFTVCVGYDDAGRPLEVFADGQKTGSTMAAFTVDEALARATALRRPAEAVLVRDGKYHRIKRVRFEQSTEERAA